MGILAKCPSCGMVSAELRCPRCNALKAVGCSGACALCLESCESSAIEPTPVPADPALKHESSAAGSDG